ncbi:MAG: 50S ribosomal protein L34 [Candidatus Nealsonbacteria bacterium]
MSVTYNAKNKKRKVKHGFLKRMRTPAGQNVLSRRRKKKRKKKTV